MMSLIHFDKHLKIPSFFEQCLEIVRLIIEALENGTNTKKLMKRFERIILIFQIPNMLTDNQKNHIENLISNIKTTTRFQKIMNYSKSFIKENLSYCIGHLSNMLRKNNEIPVFPTSKSVELLSDKADSQSFLTSEMHNTPLLFFVGIWMNKLIAKNIIEEHKEEFNNRHFIIEGKGGGFMAYSALVYFHMSLDLARNLIQNAGRGDVDIGILISPHVDNFEKLRSSICDTVNRTMLQITDTYGDKDSILSDIIRELLKMSPKITQENYCLYNRKSFKMLKKNIIFNTISDDESKNNDDKFVFTSRNKTLEFIYITKKISFELNRICISFVKIKDDDDDDGNLFKSELLDISIQGLDDTDLQNGSFYKFLEISMDSPDFLHPIVFNKIMDYYSRLDYKIPNNLVEMVKLLITLKL